MDEGGRDLIEETLRQFSGGTEEHHKKSQDNPCPDGDSNRTPPNTSSERCGYANALGVRPSGFTHFTHKCNRKRIKARLPVQGWTLQSCTADEWLSDTLLISGTHHKNTGATPTHEGVHFKLGMWIIFIVTPYVPQFSYPVCTLKYSFIQHLKHKKSN
jgi:hypothetical protein